VLGLTGSNLQGGGHGLLVGKRLEGRWEQPWRGMWHGASDMGAVGLSLVAGGAGGAARETYCSEGFVAFSV
jgi:hypothetical protein